MGRLQQSACRMGCPFILAKALATLDMKAAIPRVNGHAQRTAMLLVKDKGGNDVQLLHYSMHST